MLTGSSDLAPQIRDFETQEVIMSSSVRFVKRADKRRSLLAHDLDQVAKDACHAASVTVAFANELGSGSEPRSPASMNSQFSILQAARIIVENLLL